MLFAVLIILEWYPMQSVLHVSETAGLASRLLISGNTANSYISPKEITSLTLSRGLVNTNESKEPFTSCYKSHLHLLPEINQHHSGDHHQLGCESSTPRVGIHCNILDLYSQAK